MDNQARQTFMISADAPDAPFLRSMSSVCAVGAIYFEHDAGTAINFYMAHGGDNKTLGVQKCN